MVRPRLQRDETSDRTRPKGVCVVAHTGSEKVRTHCDRVGAHQDNSSTPTNDVQCDATRMPSQAERAGTDRKEAMTVPTPTAATGKRRAVAQKEALRDAKATLRRPERCAGGSAAAIGPRAVSQKARPRQCR